jgi:glutathione synthase/RimK-type ligase-like ATP-grasp enzyme
VILIISNTEDLTSDFVVREIRSRNLPFARLNTDEFPTTAFGTFSVDSNNSDKAILKWSNRPHILNWNQVSSVYYRRPQTPVPDSRITNPALRKFCADESYDFLRGLWYSLDCLWMSNPEAIRKSEHKLYQLKVAKQLSFIIPNTVATNEPEEVKRFFYECKNGVIVKPLYLGFIDDEKSPKFIFTSIVREEDLKDINSVRLTPSIFQERIDKQFDVRVTVVGEKVFAAKIEPGFLPEGIPDWRYADMENLQHTSYDLPKDVEEKCRTLVHQLGLNFGAIDFVVDQDNKHFFLEINPNGQWAWLENVLDIPISQAIVDFLDVR